jgi:hypothetical protein
LQPGTVALSNEWTMNERRNCLTLHRKVCWI